VELGYRLTRASWGKGYATEAAGAVMEHAFTSLGLERLVSLIDPENIASLRVAQKLGMQFEREIILPGYSHPDHMYAIIQQEWRD
jgi:RimJ/RimL family protein N-acetyltransferase